MSPYLDRSAPDQTRSALIGHLARKLEYDAAELACACASLATADLIDCLVPDPQAARARIAEALIARHPREAALVACEPAVSPEAKSITHDGPIWPRARHDMTDARIIAERMAEDIIAMARESADSRVLESDLAAIGWLWPQIHAHGGAAVRLANAALGLEDAA